MTSVTSLHNGHFMGKQPAFRLTPEILATLLYLYTPLLLFRLESAYSLNEGVQKVWGNVLKWPISMNYSSVTLFYVSRGDRQTQQRRLVVYSFEWSPLFYDQNKFVFTS